jgi:acyl carrier protein
MSTTTTTERVERVVIDAIHDFAPDADDVTRDSTFEALEIDSLDLVELGQVVEDQFGVKLESADVGELGTVGDVVDLVAARAS